MKDLLSGNVSVQPVMQPAAPRRRWSLAAAALALAAVATAGVYWRGPVGAATDSIAVLPFVNDSGNAELDYLGDGVTESLINSLSRVPSLSVMSRNSVFRFKGREADAQAAGRALNVRTVLTGRVAQRGDALTISAELIEVGNNRQVWGEQFNRKLADLQAVQDAISTEISDRLRVTLTVEERRQLTKRYTENTEAYQLYLKGRYYWNKKTPDGFNRGIEHLEKAITVDPNYAPAYAALSEVYTNLANYNFGLMLPKEAWEKSRAAVTRALELDDTLAAGHSSLAIAIYQWEWDWPAAEREFKRAIELDPSSATTHHWYSHYLMTMGRVEESFREGRRALELDPLDLANNAHVGWHSLFLRHYDESHRPVAEGDRAGHDLSGSAVVSRTGAGTARRARRGDRPIRQLRTHHRRRPPFDARAPRPCVRGGGAAERSGGPPRASAHPVEDDLRALIRRGGHLRGARPQGRGVRATREGVRGARQLDGLPRPGSAARRPAGRSAVRRFDAPHEARALRYRRFARPADSAPLPPDLGSGAGFGGCWGHVLHPAWRRMVDHGDRGGGGDPRELRRQRPGDADGAGEPADAARSELEGDWMLVGFEAPGGPRKAAGFLRYDRFANISVHAELAGDEPSAQPPRTVVADFTAKANPTDGQFAYTGLQAGVDTGRLTPDAVEMQEWRHYALSGDTLRLSLAGGAATLVFQRSK